MTTKSDSTTKPPVTPAPIVARMLGAECHSCSTALLQRALLILLGPLFLMSCVNMTAIREFAVTATDVAGYTSLTDAYVASPKAMKIYMDDTNAAKLDKISAEREKQKAGLLALHTGISSYMSALADLAADDLVQYDSQVDSLTSALGKANIKGVDAKAISAFGALAKVVAKAATDHYRQRHLKEMIQSSNESFQRAVKTMESIVDKAYVTAFADNELKAIRQRREEITAMDAAGNREPAALQLLKQDAMQREAEVQAKVEACHEYAKAISKIREGHQKLYDTLGKVPLKEVAHQLKGYKTEVQALFKAVKEINK